MNFSNEAWLNQKTEQKCTVQSMYRGGCSVSQYCDMAAIALASLSNKEQDEADVVLAALQNMPISR